MRWIQIELPAWEAGMNDHVGKPFQVDSLVEVLVRHSLP